MSAYDAAALRTQDLAGLLHLRCVHPPSAAGGAKSRSSYGGIFAFQNLHREIGHLFGSQEPRSLNPGGRKIFEARDDDVYLCVLRKSHGFRQFDFATLDDCLVGENLDRISLSPAHQRRRSCTGFGLGTDVLEPDDAVHPRP